MDTTHGITKIILGIGGTGKTYFEVKKAIEEHQGRVIWISREDDIDYLGLAKSVKDVSISKLKTLKNFTKIHIPCNIYKQPVLSNTEIYDLLMFIEENINAEDVLFIVDDGISICPSIISFLLKSPKSIFSSSNKIIIANTYEQLSLVLNQQKNE